MKSHCFSTNTNFNFLKSGFCATSQLFKNSFSYSHITTDMPIQELAKIHPELKFGMGEIFAAMLEKNSHRYFFYFEDDLSSFSQIKDAAQKKSFFNLQNFFYDINKFYFIDSKDLYYERSEVILDSQEVDINILMEAVLFCESNQVKLRLPDELNICGKVSPYFFKTILEEIVKKQVSYETFQFMIEWDILRDFFPELQALKGVEQDKDHHPEGDALDHVMECLKYFKGKNILLFWAVLLHDLGKASASRNQDRRFDQHGKLGVLPARKVLDRFSYDEEFIEKVLFLVSHHMYPVFIPKMTDKEKQKLITHPLQKELFQLFKFDILGSHKDMNLYTRMKKLLFRSTGT